MKPGASYYAGGARVVVEGVPIRLARKPSAHNLVWSRENVRYLEKPFYFTRAERAEAIAAQARQDILRYAEALEISETRAKALIAQHRQYLIANPLVNLSLEYDL